MTTKKKVLFTSHTANFSKFNRPFMRWFKEQGYEVHYASAGEEPVLDCDKHFTVGFNRSPWSLENIKAYKQLKKIIDREQYAFIHTHTPMGSVVTRLAARGVRKLGTRVVYTAHGFHFYSGAPLVNWLLYYPVEKLLAKHTDTLVTINTEDYARAKAHFKRVGSIEKIDGVGVDLSRFKPVSDNQKQRLRKTYGYSKDEFILLCVAEFTTNKSQEFIVAATKQLKREMPNLKVIFAGEGYRLEQAKTLTKTLRLQKNIDFIGYRKDIDKIYGLADVLIAASVREGLPVSIIEAMASGLPVICTKIRGHVDLITEDRNGYLYDVHNANQLTQAAKKLYDDKTLRERFTVANTEDVARYSQEQAITSMAAIYGDV